MTDPMPSRERAIREEELPREQVGENKAAIKPPQGVKPLATRRRTIFARLLLVLGSSLVGLALCEAVVRVAAAVTHRVPLVVSDAYAGWALQPNLRNQVRVGDGGQYVMSTDGEGHRLTRGTGEPPAAAGAAIILVGDSFAQGQSVNDTETCAWILDHELNRNVVNLGVLGYGTDQELAGLRAYLEAHPALDVGDIVVLVFDNDFVDVQTDSHPALGRSKPRFRVAGGRLETPAYQRSLSDRLMDFSYLYWLLNSKRAAAVKIPSLTPPGARRLSSPAWLPCGTLPRGGEPGFTCWRTGT